jgi:hypothetical protein
MKGVGRGRMARTKKTTSVRGIFSSILAVVILISSFCIQVQGESFHAYFIKSSEDNVLVPLVEENDETGIPVTLHGDYVSIRLIYPPEQTLHIPIHYETDEEILGYVIVKIIDNGEVDTIEILLQDWPQSGPVIPLSQDWPQDGLLLFNIQDHPTKNFLCLIIQQDWPQHMIDGELI